MNVEAAAGPFGKADSVLEQTLRDFIQLQSNTIAFWNVLKTFHCDQFSFKINNLTAELPLLINPTDVLTITIVKQTAGVESNMTLQEKIVR